MILFVFFHSFLELHHLCMRPESWHGICCGSIKLWEETNRFNKISRSIFTSLASYNWYIHRLWSIFYCLRVILIFLKFFFHLLFVFCFDTRLFYLLDPLTWSTDTDWQWRIYSFILCYTVFRMNLLLLVVLFFFWLHQSRIHYCWILMRLCFNSDLLLSGWCFSVFWHVYIHICS